MRNIRYICGKVKDNNYKFTSRELDIIGLYSRYYDHGTERFISPDPLQDEHPYAYCGSDPVNFVDLTGLQRVIHCPWTAGGDWPTETGSYYMIVGGLIQVGRGIYLPLLYFLPVMPYEKLTPWEITNQSLASIIGHRATSAAGEWESKLIVWAKI